MEYVAVAGRELDITNSSHINGLFVVVIDRAAAAIPHVLVVSQLVFDETLRGLPGFQPPHEDLTVRCLLLNGEMVVDAEDPDPASDTGVVCANDLSCLEELGEFLSWLARVENG